MKHATRDPLCPENTESDRAERAEEKKIDCVFLSLFLSSFPPALSPSAGAPPSSSLPSSYSSFNQKRNILARALNVAITCVRTHYTFNGIYPRINGYSKWSMNCGRVCVCDAPRAHINPARMSAIFKTLMSFN